eukprot:3653649-Pleurochrysis_carterae.AAC.1
MSSSIALPLRDILRTSVARLGASARPQRSMATSARAVQLTRPRRTAPRAAPAAAPQEPAQLVATVRSRRHE